MCGLNISAYGQNHINLFSSPIPKATLTDGIFEIICKLLNTVVSILIRQMRDIGNKCKSSLENLF